MKKITLLVALFATLILLGATPALAAEKTVAASEKSYLSKIDGHSWQNSSKPEKLAFISGIEGAFAIEKALQDKEKEKPAKEQTKYLLTPYGQGWVESALSKSPESIMGVIDAYYLNNQDKLDRNVFEVIWYEIIAPAKKGA